MQTPIAKRSIRLWVMAWFVMALFASVASALMQSKAMEIVCSGSGAVRLVIKTTDGLVAADAAGMHCPLCLAADAPPPTHTLALIAAPVPAFFPRIYTHVSTTGGWVLRPPARAPPVFS